MKNVEITLKEKEKEKEKENITSFLPVKFKCVSYMPSCFFALSLFSFPSTWHPVGHTKTGRAFATAVVQSKNRVL
jgi:preprotein translocase subunit SecY